MTDAIEKPPRAIRLAILAMGGEGGGVLADWVVDLAEHHGWIAQTTSVPGVAQRTGATIYYVELFPKSGAGANRGAPVLALMPTPGDVDIVIASELMEAARAVQRGLVTPDRTTLVASTHRVFAIGERLAMGDGRADDAALLEACRKAARTLVAGDLAAIADRNGSVISAALFGALAGAKALPFGPEAFAETIRRGGVGVATSLKAFAAAAAAAEKGDTRPAPPPAPAPAPMDPGVGPAAAAQLARVNTLPAPAREFARLGVERLVDFQDAAYAGLFVDRLAAIAAVDEATGDGSFALTAETARWLALGMAYEDTIRVAQLKLRAERLARVREETALKDGQLLEVAEFLHPRLQEIAETVPAGLGRFLLSNRLARRAVERLTASGRVVETTSVRGFLMLYAVAGLRKHRRRSMRYAAEQESLEAWLARLKTLAATNRALALEYAECRNLVKGYGDTHARGSANFARITEALDWIAARPDAAQVLATLRKAALADERGGKLDQAFAALG